MRERELQRENGGMRFNERVSKMQIYSVSLCNIQTRAESESSNFLTSYLRLSNARTLIVVANLINFNNAQCFSLVA